MKTIFQVTYLILLISFLAFVLPGSLGFAKGKGGRTKGMPAGFEKGEKKGWGESSVPPGWGKGDKKGWGEASLPPGLEKKRLEEE